MDFAFPSCSWLSSWTFAAVIVSNTIFATVLLRGSGQLKWLLGGGFLYSRLLRKYQGHIHIWTQSNDHYILKTNSTKSLFFFEVVNFYFIFSAQRVHDQYDI